jgi:hypothetical protein
MEVTKASQARKLWRTAYNAIARSWVSATIEKNEVQSFKYIIIKALNIP